MIRIDGFVDTHVEMVRGSLRSVCATGVEFDSRKITPGKIFIALQGQRTDGHSHLRQAEAKGACAVIVERFSDAISIPQICVADTTQAMMDLAREQRHHWQDKTVVALTGSLGKTSSKEFLKSILEKQAKTYATQGNYNNRLGLSYTMLNVPADARYVVLELGISEVGEMEQLADLAKPDVAFITNIAACHLKGLGSIGNIAEEKAKIYAALSKNGLAIINNTDRYARYFVSIARAYRCQMVNVWNSDNMVDRSSLTVNVQGCAKFRAVLAAVKLDIELGVMGTHQVDNAFACAVIANRLGVSHENIIQGLSAVKAMPGRMQSYQEPSSGALLIDDSYNASPESMQAAIACLAESNRKDKCLVIGEMHELGGKSDKMHRQIGVWANEKKIDCLLAVGEKARLALEEFQGDGHAFDEKNDLLNHLRERLHNDMVVLFKASRAVKLEECVQPLVGVE